MTSIDKTILRKINKLEQDVNEHGKAINACLDLIQGMDDYVERELKISTPEKIQKNWEKRRGQLLRDAGVALGKSKKKSSRTKKVRKSRTKRKYRI